MSVIARDKCRSKRVRQRLVRREVTRRLRPFGASIVCVLLSGAVIAASAGAAECPNEAIREAQHAVYLPECRAYELASPAEKGPGSIGTGSYAETSISGDALNFISETPLLGSSAGPVASTVRMIRTANGWQRVEDPISAPLSTVGNSWFPSFTASPGLDSGVISAPTSGLLTPDAPKADPNIINPLWIRDLYRWRAGQPPEAINTLPPQSQIEEISANFGFFFPEVAGASSDLSRIFFEAPGTLAPGGRSPSTAALNLYEWDEGAITLAAVMPDGEPADGSTAGARSGFGASSSRFQFGGGAQNAITVSPDGARVYFNAPVPVGQERPSGQLYLRFNGSTTVVSESQAAEPDPHGGPFPAEFQMASPDGSVAYFVSSGALTDDANTGSAPIEEGEHRGNLYRYDAGSGQLTDLTPTEDPVNELKGASVRGVIGASSDGSVLYFIASGVLDPGHGVVGEENLYSYHEGQIHFVGIVDGLYESAIALNPFSSVAVSPSGSYLGLSTRTNLTDYDSDGQVEVYLWSLEDGQMTCVSCPDGPASNNAFFSKYPMRGSTLIDPTSNSHYVSDTGKVIFESREALAPGTDNGVEKVYEWSNGSARKLSSGSAEGPEHPYAVSAGGTDVFFTSFQRLVPADHDNALDFYDARIGGGFREGTPPLACAEAGCRAGASSPVEGGGIGSDRISGPGFDGPTCRSLEKRATRQRDRARRARKHHHPTQAAHAAKAARRLTRESKSCKSQGGSR
jgi:hypothetical protein